MNPDSVRPNRNQLNTLRQLNQDVAATGQQAPCTACHSVALGEPELLRVIHTWSILSHPVKKAVLALVDTAKVADI